MQLKTCIAITRIFKTNITNKVSVSKRSAFGVRRLDGRFVEFSVAGTLGFGVRRPGSALDCIGSFPVLLLRKSKAVPGYRTPKQHPRFPLKKTLPQSRIDGSAIVTDCKSDLMVQKRWKYFDTFAFQVAAIAKYPTFLDERGMAHSKRTANHHR